MVLNSIPDIKLEGEIVTNSQGINKLMQFYNAACKYHHVEINLDCSGLDFLDANLTAFLNALQYRLHRQNNIRFTTDVAFLSKKFGVLFRNGWLKDEAIQITDVQNTTIPCTCFNSMQSDEFVGYIKKQLLCHRGITLTTALCLRIENDLIEIYNNIAAHAGTTDPFFVCGQYYPKLGQFVFTMVDLGLGFLPPIQSYTNQKIDTHIDAIRWALDGNSTTGENLAGMGLQSIYDYCKTGKAGLQIYTGDAFWGTDIENTIFQGHRSLQYPFQGSLINLFFHQKP